jgi:hypothetical protein
MERPGHDDRGPEPATPGGRIEVTFEIDLGELIPGHHVIARGLERGHIEYPEVVEPSDSKHVEPPNFYGNSGPVHPVAPRLREWKPALHFDVVPDLLLDEEGASWFESYVWGCTAEDDVGTNYGDGNYDSSISEGGQGYLDLRAQIPESATLLTLRFQPPTDWTPPEPWVSGLEIDLQTGQVTTLPEHLEP